MLQLTFNHGLTLNGFRTTRPRTLAVHVRYKSLYISLPSSAKQQRDMTKFWRRLRNVDDEELNALIPYLASARF